MSDKKFFVGTICLFGLFLTMIFIVIYSVDPIGIFGARVISGFNHYKIKQGLYLDVCKPYEYMREKPDILYLGGSQESIGFKPDGFQNTGKKEYAMGLSALTLPDMKEYLKFICKVHKPEHIYIGLMPESFGRSSYYRNREGYSNTRLEMLAGNAMEFGAQMITDSFSLHGTCVPTIKESFIHKDDEKLMVHGWNVKRGSGKLQPRMYYYYIDKVILRYQDWEFCPEAFKCFAEIVNEAKAADVPITVFFVPLAVDCYAMTELLGYLPEVQKIKRIVASYVPVYDFYVVNSLTTNRETYFSDAVHFKSSCGEKLKPILAGKEPPEPYGYLLTPETIDDAFAAEDAAWEKWRAEHAEYVQALKEYIESGRKPKVGDFEKYIGF